MPRRCGSASTSLSRPLRPLKSPSSSKGSNARSHAGETVLDAMAAGQLNTGQAAKVLNSFAQLTRIAEFDELKREMAKMRKMLEERR